MTVAEQVKARNSEAALRAEIALHSGFVSNRWFYAIFVFVLGLCPESLCKRFPNAAGRFLGAELAQFHERRVKLGPAAVAQIFPGRFDLFADRGITLLK